ncbi:MAG: A/G-specific adenine glycosylase [Candidatus Omnitrophota bacterium]|nr:MAG: A/G-specific adenine glycosylase [Candidatus Omnitrophota bacterium]
MKSRRKESGNTNQYAVSWFDPLQLKKHKIRRSLLAWFKKNARDLPWRKTRDAYRIWISEIMLQQTRVEAVVPYFQRFVAAFPTVKELANAKEDHVLKLWEGLGYYSRARNLRKAAKKIVGDHAGVFPRTLAEIQSLPGVGRYTAGAIASIAFGARAPVVDGNVKRVLARVFCMEDSIDAASTTAAMWELAEQLVPPGNPGDFNQALMELGARICAPKNPRCEQCPIAAICEARTKGMQGDLPIRRRKNRIPHYHIVAAAIRKNGRYLLGKRPPHSMLGGMWEFPGGKIEAGETHEQALKRELREELGVEILVKSHLISVDHAYSHFSITLHVYLCEHIDGIPRTHYHTDLKWVFRSQFDRYPMPAADLKFLHLL